MKIARNENDPKELIKIIELLHEKLSEKEEKLHKIERKMSEDIDWQRKAKREEYERLDNANFQMEHEETKEFSSSDAKYK